MSSVLITGANRGLGLEMARQYVADGDSVIALCRRSSAELDALESGSALEKYCLDLTDDRALEKFEKTLGNRVLDVVINNAGTMGDSSFAESGLSMQQFGSFDRAEWHRVFDINVCTPMKISELFAARLADAGGGKLITITSIVGSTGLNKVGGLYAYRASKAAVNAIVRSMAVDLASRHIVAVGLHPGWAQTDMGGPQAEIDVATSVSGMRNVIANLGTDDSGHVLQYDGSRLPY